MVSIVRRAWLEVLAEAWRVYPHEACGVLLGSGDGTRIEQFTPVANAAASSRIFELDSLGYMKAERAADDAGLSVIGVMHSHTHTAAYPSATDIAEATKPLVPPSWHWLIVSLAWGFPETRSFAVSPAGDFHPQHPDFLPAGIAEERLRLIDW